MFQVQGRLATSKYREFLQLGFHEQQAVETSTMEDHELIWWK
jgi:hypothetical protein